ncbi:MAG: hypothetical protein HZY76_21570 [Anaerolineae bacterium]|nr:MAG: hypothetical protein HZY76_21570 [Anaerolineae bacterium]
MPDARVRCWPASRWTARLISPVGHFWWAASPSTTRVAQALRTVHGQWEDGDQFVLMTDALAAWFLAAHAAGEQPMQTLEGLR